MTQELEELRKRIEDVHTSQVLWRKYYDRRLEILEKYQGNQGRGIQYLFDELKEREQGGDEWKSPNESDT